jgi:tRNA(Arg) A34 adenosine deaminase TadA
MTLDQCIVALRVANEVARETMQKGHHPFGAVLIAPDGDTVLMRQGNINTLHHAEATMIRTASEKFGAEYLWNCSVVTTVEPCAMCSGTQYWANIGRVVYGMSESQLLELTGNHGENPTLDLPCRDVFARGQKKIEVIGPVLEMQAEIAALHADFWRNKN